MAHTFTYERSSAGRVIGEEDVRIDYEGGPWGWSVEQFDLTTGKWFDAPRDEHDRIMTWAWSKYSDFLHEVMRDYATGRRARDLELSRED